MGKDLDEMQGQDLTNLLAESSDVICHCIGTGTAAPVRQWPYRLPYTKLETVRKELQVMKDMSVITPSSSEWAAPIILVLVQGALMGA